MDGNPDDPTEQVPLDLNSVDDDEILGQTDIEGPVMKKESKAKHESDVRDAYLNPFKPENIQKNEEMQTKNYQKKDDI